MSPNIRTGSDAALAGPRYRFPFRLLLLLISLLAGCGVNNLPTYDEAVKASWA